MAKILGLSKNNDKYANVPDALKWAIPLHEWVTRPEALAEAQAMTESSKKRVEAELKAKRKVQMASIPKTT